MDTYPEYLLQKEKKEEEKKKKKKSCKLYTASAINHMGHNNKNIHAHGTVPFYEQNCILNPCCAEPGYTLPLQTV